MSIKKKLDPNNTTVSCLSCVHSRLFKFDANSMTFYCDFRQSQQRFIVSSCSGYNSRVFMYQKD